MAAGQLIEASNSELQGSMKKRDPLKYETSNEDAIRRQMEVGKQVSNRAVAILVRSLVLNLTISESQHPGLVEDQNLAHALLYPSQYLRSAEYTPTSLASF